MTDTLFVPRVSFPRLPLALTHKAVDHAKRVGAMHLKIASNFMEADHVSEMWAFVREHIRSDGLQG